MKIKLTSYFSVYAVFLVFLVVGLLFDNRALKILAFCALGFAVFVYIKGLHRTIFRPNDKYQKAIFAMVIAILILCSFFLCAVSIEKQWVHEYPLKGSVDNYGCYPQMFDAFQKGQLNIDTEYDLSVIDSLENPYDTKARREATGEKFGVIWDRAYFQGKLYSYFGVAPVIFLYYPFYFLTGAIPSDALAAAIMVSVAIVFLMLILWELCARIKGEVPFILMILGGIALTFGSLLWSTETCANFYHLAVLSGICAVAAFFWFILKAEMEKDGLKRKLFFAIAGISVGAIVASRPNLVLYVFIAFPLLFDIIRKKPNGVKSLFGDIFAFMLPMLAMGGMIMWYNHARFGSPFDFGANYQLTLTDTSTYSLSAALFFPSLYHFFFNAPGIDDAFPFIHPLSRRLAEYGVHRLVYVDKTVGALFFPATWGIGFLPLIRKNLKGFLTGIIAILSVVFIAFFDMCYGGVHLRYSADIMFILMLLGVYLLILAVSKAKKGSNSYAALYTFVIILFAITVLLDLPLCFDNERDMILKFHREFYNFVAL